MQAIRVIEEFHECNNAILIVDEWVSLAQKIRKDLEGFWDCLSPKASALTSNGVGCGRAVWAIAPTFQAATMCDAAKVVKNFIPCILSIAPGQSIDWKNPNTGVTSKIPYNAALIGQAQKNWAEAGILEPTEEDARYWQRTGKSRVFWFEGRWSALDPAPAMPSTNSTPTAQPSNPAQSFGAQTAIALRTPPIAVRQEVAALLMARIKSQGDRAVLEQVRQLTEIGQERSAFRVMIESQLKPPTKTSFCKLLGVEGGSKFQGFGDVYDWIMEGL